MIRAVHAGIGLFRMSLETQRWAYKKENVPYKAKVRADDPCGYQADEVTGEVCYQRTDVKFFVEKLCMPERSFYRCVAALVRQGYLRRESERGGQQPKYWLCMKREPTLIEKWSLGGPEKIILRMMNEQYGLNQ